MLIKANAKFRQKMAFLPSVMLEAGVAGVWIAAVVVAGEVLQSLGPDGMMFHRARAPVL
jgi:hypothetical protein